MTENEKWEPKIVGFVCNWCTYAGADSAGMSRMEYPANIRLIRVPCSGRLNPMFVIKAFEKGADGVLISGCHPGDCHYISGNKYARRKFTVLKSLLDFMGIEEGRFWMSWVSASEARKFADLVAEITHKVRELGPLKSFSAAK